MPSSTTLAYHSLLSDVPKQSFKEEQREEDKDIQTAIALSLQTQLNLAKEVASYGLECKDVPHDGACFYSALADQLDQMKLYNTKFNAADLRELTQKHVRANKEIYQPFVDGDIDQLISRIGKPYEWVDNVEIMALSRELGINIVILRSDAQTPTIVKQSQTTASALVGYEVGSHYQSLVPIEKQVDNLKNIDELIAKASEDNVQTIKTLTKAENAETAKALTEPQGWRLPPTQNLFKFGVIGVTATVGLFALYKIYKGDDMPPTPSILLKR